MRPQQARPSRGVGWAFGLLVVACACAGSRAVRPPDLPAAQGVLAAVALPTGYVDEPCLAKPMDTATRCARSDVVSTDEPSALMALPVSLKHVRLDCSVAGVALSCDGYGSLGRYGVALTVMSAPHRGHLTIDGTHIWLAIVRTRT